MSIEPRGNTFRSRMTIKGEQYYGTFNTLLDAEAHEASIKAQVAKGLPIVTVSKRTNTDITLKELMDETFKNVWEHQADWKNALYLSAAIVRFYGEHTKAKHITRQRIQDYVNHLRAQGRNGSTVNRHLAKIRKALNYGKDNQYLSFVPKMPMQPEEQGRIIFWNKDEEQEIIDTLYAIGHEEFVPFFEWQIDTGMRPNEARQIRKDYVRFDPTKEVWFCDIPDKIAKWKIGRTIPLTTRAYWSFKQSNEDMPFAKWENGTNRDVWNKVRKKLGNNDPEFKFYCTRHSCATRLLQGGMPIKNLKDWLGHMNISTTERYAKLVPSDLVTGLDILGG